MSSAIVGDTLSVLNTSVDKVSSLEAAQVVCVVVVGVVAEDLTVTVNFLSKLRLGALRFWVHRCTAFNQQPSPQEFKEIKYAKSHGKGFSLHPNYIHIQAQNS